MSDLLPRIENDLRLAEMGVREIGPRGRAYAEAEAAYRVALAEKMLRLKADGYPATMVGDLARGDKDVSRLKVARDCAEALYKAAFEAVNFYKLDARLSENQAAREMGQE